MEKSTVVSIPINKNYKTALETIFNTFPEITKKIKTAKNIFIKINLDNLHVHQHTDLELLQLILEFIRINNPSASLFVMDNNLYGNFARLLANVTGITSLTKSFKAKFIYLDEKKTIPITIGSTEDRYKIHFPQVLIDQLISNRNQNFYLNLAPLKTHYQTKVAGGLLNQIGLINQQSFRFVHSHYLHQTIVDLFAYLQPDFTIIDAQVVLKHSFMPPENLTKKYTLPINRLLGSMDALAVDCIALGLLGYKRKEIEHIQLAIQRGLSKGDRNSINLIGIQCLITY